MSEYAGDMVHPATRERLPAYSGWNWPSFFFGPLWYLGKGMIGEGLLGCAIYLFSFGWAWLVGLWLIPLHANYQYRVWLWHRGWTFEDADAQAEPTPPLSREAAERLAILRPYRTEHDSRT